MPETIQGQQFESPDANHSALPDDFAWGALEALPGPTCLLGPRGEIRWSNPAWNQHPLLAQHFPPRTHIPQVFESLPDLQNPAASQTAAGLRSVLEGPAASFTGEFPWQQPGATFWFAVRVARLPQGGLLTLADQTAARQDALEQAALEIRHLAQAEAGFDGLVISENGIVQDANQQTADMLGYQVAELVGRDIRSLVVPAEVEKVNRRLETQPGSRTLYRGLRKDGGEILAEVRSIAREVNGRPLRFTSIRDLTERQKYEQDLTERNRLIEAILQNAPMGLLLRSLGDGQVRYINQQFEDILGGPMTTMQDFFKIAYPDPAQRERILALVVPELSGSGPTRRRWENILIPRPDAEPRYVTITSVPLPERDLSVTTLEDVSEKVRADQALQAALLRMKTVFDFAPLAVTMHDENDLIQLWNPAAERLFGWREADLLGKSSPIVPPDLLGEFESIRDQNRGGQIQPEIETVRLHKDGSLVPVNISAAPILDGHNRVVGRVAIFTDISLRKKAEERQRMLSTALDAAANPIIITDVNGSVEWVNQAWCQLTGYSSAEALGQNPRILKSGLHEQTFYKEMWHTILSGQVWRGELVNKKKDGSLYYEEQTIRCVRDENGQISHFVGIKLEITERKRTERLLQARLKLAGMAGKMELKAFLQLALDESEALTESRAGFFHFISEDQDNIQLQTWSTNALAGGCKVDVDEAHYPLELAGVWAEAVRQRRTIVVNDYAGLAAHQGLPEGHLSLRRFIVTPLLHEERVIGVIGVGNKDSDYAQSDVLLHEQMAAEVGEIVLRMQAEEASRKSFQRLLNIIEFFPDPAFVVDTDKKIIAWNRALEEMTGVPKQTVMGRADFNSLVPLFGADRPVLLDYLDLPAEEISRRFKTITRQGDHLYADVYYPGELPLHPGREGSYLWAVAAPLRDRASGETWGAVEVIRDVTQNRQLLRDMQVAQRELEELNRDLEKRVEERTTEVRRSEATYRALFENSNDGIFLISPEGNDISANQQALTMLGYSLDEFLEISRRQPNYVAAPQQRDDALDRLAAALRGEYVPLYERTFLAKDGREVQCEVLLSPVRDASGKIIMVQSVARDISERKKAQAELSENRDQLSRLNAAIEKASKLKDEFLASMSHELRTPLTGILGLSEVLEMQSYGPLNDRQLKAVHTLNASGRHLLDLINDILDLSKVEAGKFDLQLEQVIVDDACKASLSLIKGMAGQKKINVNYEIEQHDLLITADQRRLKQIIVNLLSNAVKFTPEKGRVGLEVRRDEPTRSIIFIVWDTGIGIRPADMERLFRPFVQLDQGQQLQFAGTGLGLSLVQRMVELHNGTIQVESEPGQGSRFIISLPWSGETIHLAGELPMRALPPAARPTGPQFVGRNLLVVDDNPTNLELMEQMMGNAGFHVVPANSGFEALELIPAALPDVILMDIQMPGIDGLETTRRLRALPDPELANIPVIAVTALAMTGDRERCLAAGADDYLTRPISFPDLLKKIADFLKD